MVKVNSCKYTSLIEADNIKHWEMVVHGNVTTILKQSLLSPVNHETLREYLTGESNKLEYTVRRINKERKQRDV